MTNALRAGAVLAFVDVAVWVLIERRRYVFLYRQVPFASESRRDGREVVESS